MANASLVPRSKEEGEKGPLWVWEQGKVSLFRPQTLSGAYIASGIMQESDLCGVDLGLRASGEWDVHKPPVYGSSP